jgi:hypothetical protein
MLRTEQQSVNDVARDGTPFIIFRFIKLRQDSAHPVTPSSLEYIRYPESVITSWLRWNKG